MDVDALGGDGTWRIFCRMKVATVLESSEPDSMMRRQRGMISVVRRKVITICSSVFTSAPITPSLNRDITPGIVRGGRLGQSGTHDVRRRYSKGRVRLVVCRKG